MNNTENQVKQTNTPTKKQKGFTLIELMVVIVILGLLVAVLAPQILGQGDKARVETTKITLEKVSNALEMYKLDNYRYPNTDEGLQALVQEPESAKNWIPGGYIKGGVPKDSWDNELVYEAPGRDGKPFDLLSYGADGQEGGDGIDSDLEANW